MMKVAASSAHPDVATKWTIQIDRAKSWEELVDPPALQQLGLKLANAATEIVPASAVSADVLVYFFRFRKKINASLLVKKKRKRKKCVKTRKNVGKRHRRS